MGDTLLDGVSYSKHDCFAAVCRVHPSSDEYRSAKAEAFKVKTVGEKYKFKRAVFFLHKNGNPTGHLIARLYAMTGTYGTDGKPTGSPLTSSNLVDIASLPSSPTGQQINFIFPVGQQYVVEKDHTYCIAMEVYDGNVDPNNNIQVADCTDPSVHDGNGAHYKEGAWSED